MGFRVRQRREWGARAPVRKFGIATPTPKLYLHHSVSSGADDPIVRSIQNYHMDVRKWSDIAYSFLIDDDANTPGDVYEGRGVGVSGGHTAGQNTVSHAICVIGNFSSRLPRPRTLEALAWLVALGHMAGWWPNRITGGHRDAPGATTSCPGSALYQHIPTINKEIEKVLNMPKVEVIAGFTWTDVDEWPKWAENDIRKNIIAGVIRGHVVGPESDKRRKFAPDESLTRAQAAALLSRIGAV